MAIAKSSERLAGEVLIVFPDRPDLALGELPSPAAFGEFHPFLKGVFSQWHPTRFVIEDIEYNCAEQYMMAAKAVLFRDLEAAERIMKTDDPALQKRLGARVHGFDEALWTKWRLHIVYQASIAKFTQNPGAQRQLLRTAPAMLVEANPRDWNWGNGLQLDDPANQDPASWKGENLLGKILTLVREELTNPQI